MRVLARSQATAGAGPAAAGAAGAWGSLFVTTCCAFMFLPFIAPADSERLAPGLAGRTTGGTSVAACQPRSRALRAGQPRRSRSLAASSSLDEAAAAAASSSERGAADAVQPAPSGSQAADQLSPEDIAADYLQHCQQEYGRPGLIEFTEGAGGLPKAVLMHPSGSRAEVYLHGGTVTSWRHADGREMLHMREGNTFDGVQPIRWAAQLHPCGAPSAATPVSIAGRPGGVPA